MTSETPANQGGHGFVGPHQASAVPAAPTIPAFGQAHSPAPGAGTAPAVASPTTPHTVTVSSGMAATPSAPPTAPTPGGTSKAGKGSGKVKVVVVVAAAVLVVGAIVGLVLYPNVAATITRNDRAAFAEHADEFITAYDTWQQKASKVPSSEEFPKAAAMAKPYLKTMQSEIASMRDIAAKLDGQPRRLADTLVSRGEKLITEVEATVEAMADGEQEKITAHADRIEEVVSEYNAAVKEWNAQDQ